MKRYSISEICDILGGGTPKTTIPEYWNGDIPWLSVKDFNNDDAYVYETEKKITQEGLKHCSATLLEKDDIVISARGTVGALTLIPFPMTFNQSCYGLRGKRELVDKHYLFYKLKNSFQSFLANSHGSVFNTITRDTFNNICIQLPDLSEQQRIAKILSTIDAKIELNKKISRELEAMAKELYDYWFVQFDFPNEQGKPYKSSGGKMVWNKTLKREIPEGWEVGNIFRIANLISGGTPSKRIKQYWQNGDIPFFAPTDYDDSVFQFSTKECITKLGLQHCSSSLLKEGSVIIAARGSIGKLTITGVPMAMNQSCYALFPKNESLEYLYFLTLQLIESLKIKGSGSVFKSIITSDIENSPLSIGTESIIQLYCSKTKAIMERIKINTREIVHLIVLRNQLLPLLMNGQVRVSEKKVSSVSQKDNTNRFVLWKNTYPVAARGEKSDTVLRAMYDAMDDEDK